MQPKRKVKRRAGTADAKIGARVREARLAAVYSQAGLGKALEVSFQQVQKWEQGINRISTVQLIEISAVLHHPVAYFLQDVIAPADWGVSEVQKLMMDALEAEPMLFLEHFINMTARQRESVSLLVEDLAKAYKHQSAA